MISTGHKTQFLIWVGGQEMVNLRVFCNDVMIDEIPVEQDDDIILTKPVEHGSGNYMYSFFLEYQDVDNQPYHKEAVILWNVLVDDKPYGNFIDSLHSPDLGWMKNNLWQNDKALIFPNQSLELLLNLRSDYVTLDNQTPLKHIKTLNKLLLHPLEDKDEYQIKRTGHVYEDYTLCSLIKDETKGPTLVIKEKHLLSEEELEQIQTQRVITTKVEYLTFVDQSLAYFNMGQTLPEYYNQYIELVQPKDLESTKTEDVRAGKMDIPEQYKS
tara:strand:+ start:247 stop:1056 length:810 start_codon:yes stop_codon:yes gene_type:complete